MRDELHEKMVKEGKGTSPKKRTEKEGRTLFHPQHSRVNFFS